MAKDTTLKLIKKTIYVNSSTWDKFEKLAKKDDSTTQQFLRFCMNMWIRKMDGELKKSSNPKGG